MLTEANIVAWFQQATISFQPLFFRCHAAMLLLERVSYCTSRIKPIFTQICHSRIYKIVQNSRFILALYISISLSNSVFLGRIWGCLNTFLGGVGIFFGGVGTSPSSVGKPPKFPPFPLPCRSLCSVPLWRCSRHRAVSPRMMASFPQTSRLYRDRMLLPW